MRTIVIALCLIVGACANPAQIEQVNATQAVVDQNVRAGKMTEAEGRAVMANLKATQDAERRRNYAIAISGGSPITYQPVGGGTVIGY